MKIRKPEKGAPREIRRKVELNGVEESIFLSLRKLYEASRRPIHLNILSTRVLFYIFWILFWLLLSVAIAYEPDGFWGDFLVNAIFLCAGAIIIDFLLAGRSEHHEAERKRTQLNAVGLSLGYENDDTSSSLNIYVYLNDFNMSPVSNLTVWLKDKNGEILIYKSQHLNETRQLIMAAEKLYGILEPTDLDEGALVLRWLDSRGETHKKVRSRKDIIYSYRSVKSYIEAGGDFYGGLL